MKIKSFNDKFIEINDDTIKHLEAHPDVNIDLIINAISKTIVTNNVEKYIVDMGIII
jgi:uncharacterized protein YlzI (FlbEa/FlbD family)